MVLLTCRSFCVTVFGAAANLTGRLERWVLLLQEFDFEVIHRPGNQHLVVDYLSRLDSGEPPNGINDDFPDASLFTVHQELAGEHSGDIGSDGLGDEGISTKEPVADSLGQRLCGCGTRKCWCF